MASLRAHSDGVSFVAVKQERKFAAYYASIFEQRGRVLIARLRVGSGKASEFWINRRLTSVRIDPSAMGFAGSANFDAPHAWSGSLTAFFPGTAEVPLAGRGFRARLNLLP